MVGLAVGCFGELSSEFGQLCSFIARNMAVEYLQYCDDKAISRPSACSARAFSPCGATRLLSPGLISSWTGALGGAVISGGSSSDN